MCVSVLYRQFHLFSNCHLRLVIPPVPRPVSDSQLYSLWLRHYGNHTNLENIGHTWKFPPHADHVNSLNRAARCIVSLHISLSHSRSLEMAPFDRWQWHTTSFRKLLKTHLLAYLLTFTSISVTFVLHLMPLYVIGHWRSIVTVALSCIISEIKSDGRRKSR